MAELLYCQGRAVDALQIQWLQGWIGEHAEWSRKRLARELCLRWGWRNERGQLKDFAARSFLLKLEVKGAIQLPALQVQKRRAPRRVAELSSWEEPPVWQEPLRGLQPVDVQVISSGTEAAKRWAFYLAPFGPEPLHVRRAPPVGVEDHRVDPELVALVQQFADPRRRVVLLHDRSQDLIEMGESIELVSSADQTADLGIAELHLGNLDLRGRPWRRCGLLLPSSPPGSLPLPRG